MAMNVDQKRAARLREARQLAGYESATEAARAMGIPPPTYMAHENGTIGFARNAERYAAFFKVDLRWLMSGIGRAKGRPVEAEIADLPPEQQRQVFDYIEFLKNGARRKKGA